MIKVDLNYSKVKKENIEKLQKEVSQIHKNLYTRKGKGSEMTDWLTWPTDYNKEEVERIKKTVSDFHKEGIETLVVIGIGGSYLGSQAAIDFVKGSISTKDKVIFVGTTLSPSHFLQVEEQLKGRKWAMCVISKSGTTLEPAIAFRHFKNLLAKTHKNPNKYIIAVTDSKKGVLKELATKEGYQTFIIPDGIGGRFSGLTPVGLFPMAFAGINIEQVLAGARKAQDVLAKENIFENEAYKYATTRYILSLEKNNPIKKDLNLNSYFMEIFTVYEHDLQIFSEWWKQLFGESEGKEGKGIFPNSVLNARDLHSLGQIIQEGPKVFFSTTLWVKRPMQDIVIQRDEKDLDKINYIAGKTLYELNEIDFKSVIKAHYEVGQVPNLVIEIADRSEYTLGYLFQFFFHAVTMSGYLLGVNPFDQPGVEVYKKNIFSYLGKK